MKQKTADLILLLTSILWGLGYISSDMLLSNGMSPLVLIGSRFLIAAIILNVIFYKTFRIDFKKIKFFLLIGTTLFLAFWFQTVALKYTNTTNVSFITGMNIIFVPFISFVFYKTPMKFKHLISVVITIIGLFILTGGIDNISIGDILTVICAFLFGLHIVLISKFSKHINIISLAIVQMYITAVLAIIVSIINGNNFIQEVSQSNLSLLLFTGIIPSALCFFMQNVGLKYTDESRGSLILGSESLWGGVFAVLLLDDQLTTNLIIGGTLMMVAILIDEIKFEKSINYIKQKLYN